MSSQHPPRLFVPGIKFESIYSKGPYPHCVLLNGGEDRQNLEIVQISVLRVNRVQISVLRANRVQISVTV